MSLTPMGHPFSVSLALALPAQPPALPKARPAFGLTSLPLVQGIANVVYASEGTRYALEQTVGYTLPRTLQQLDRDKGTIGDDNTQAAQESFIRQSMADITDTFLPGLLATLLIGSTLVDTPYQHLTGQPSFVRHNMDLPALHAYEQVARQHPSAEGFYAQIEAALLAHTHSERQQRPQLNLQQAITQLVAHDVKQPLGQRMATLGKQLGGQYQHPCNVLADQLANQLGLKDMALELDLHPNAPKVAIDLPLLLTDLTHLQQANQWGEPLAKGLAATQRHKGLQQLGTLAAVLVSLSVPAGVRLLTQWQTGQDAFPGTSRLDEHWREKYNLPKGYNPHLPPKKQAQEASNTSKTSHKDDTPAVQDKGFRCFPYLEDSLKRGNPWPTLGGLAFMGTVLGVAVNHHFDLRHGFRPRFNNLKELINTYSYDRQFPYTPVKLMAVTYGLLCGLRLLNARDDSEYRESLVADGLMGWPTLTWCFPLLRGLVGHGVSQKLGQRLQAEGLLTAEQLANAPDLLAQHTSNAIGGWTFKDKADLSPTLLKHRYGLTAEQAQRMAKHLSEAHNAITVGAGLVSLTMIAIVEPKIGIALTNHFTKAKWEKASKAYEAYQTKHPTMADSHKHKGNAPMASAELGGAVFNGIPTPAQGQRPSPFVLPVATLPPAPFTLPVAVATPPVYPRTVIAPSPWVIKATPTPSP